MDEFELIRRYFVRPDEAASVIKGIGDDGAVLRAPMGKDLVTVVDTLVEGVHFPGGPAAAAAHSLGHRALAVNLSDIAAMGGEPRWMTLALTLSHADDRWLSCFASGLRALASAHKVQLVGGDTTRGAQIVVTVQVTGIVAPGRAVCRSGARPGDTIYVSGDLGDAAAGLHLTEQPPAMSTEQHEYLVHRFEYPTPRLSLGNVLAEIATAAIDVSDGLYDDLGKLLAASDAGALLEVDRIPVSAALGASFPADRQRDFALSGGDDYELCFTASDRLPDTAGGVAVRAIGTVTRKRGIVCREDGRIVDYDGRGYRHF